MEVIFDQSEEKQNLVRSKVIEHNMKNIPEEVKTSKNQYNYLLQNDDGEVVGGITATSFWYHMQLDFLWVEESYRKKGYGKALLHALENRAQEDNCRLICLDTYSFQAPDFYQRNGYEIFGVLQDHPAEGMDQYFLQKRLR